MSEAAHTPGPWRIGKSHGAVIADHPAPGVRGSDDVEAYGGHMVAESIAPQNRALVAAAPEVLDALIACRAELFLKVSNEHGPKFARQYPEIVAAEAAIAKATATP